MATRDLGLACACHAMRLAIDKSRRTGVGMVCVRNTHHLGPAGYFAHMAVEHGMLGVCMTGHFFGKGHSIGIAPLGSILPMFSTNPLSFAAPCGRHPPFVLDMSTSVATVNRIEMHAQEGRSDTGRLGMRRRWQFDHRSHRGPCPAAAGWNGGIGRIQGRRIGNDGVDLVGRLIRSLGRRGANAGGCNSTCAAIGTNTINRPWAISLPRCESMPFNRSIVSALPWTP